MSDLYNTTPGSYGGFTSPVPGGSSSAGFYQQSMNLPYHQGRSILATIPEYQRNPLLLEKDIMFKVSEGRQNFMKIIMEASELSGGKIVNDVRYRLPIEIDPLQRLYIAAGAYTGTSSLTNLKIKSNTTKISTAMPGGNPKQVGDIARLEKDQFVMLMFSWVDPRRGNKPVVATNATPSAPVPEICKVLAVDYTNGTVKLSRNWAGEQRTTTPTAPDSFTVTTTATTTANQIQDKYAFLIPMAKSMKEDEIDAKIRNYSGSWTHGVLQRHLLAWGTQKFAEVIASNLGIQSPLAKSKTQALKDYYDHWEWMALFGEKSEEFDSETGYWSGTTDGILANIPLSHHITIKDIDWSTATFDGTTSKMGSFHPIVFNKLLQGKAYHGSGQKALVCGADFYTSFTTMLNSMTQAIPSIISDWKVEGKSFSTGDGLTIQVIPSDKMSLNGLSRSAVLYDKSAFLSIGLKGYPGADIVDQISNENPLKTNGFIHGVKGFIDLNPDAHWMFTLLSRYDAGGVDNTTAYDALDPYGEYLG